MKDLKLSKFGIILLIIISFSFSTGSYQICEAGVWSSLRKIFSKAIAKKTSKLPKKVTKSTPKNNIPKSKNATKPYSDDIGAVGKKLANKNTKEHSFNRATRSKGRPSPWYSNKKPSSRTIINSKYAGKKYPPENLPPAVQKRYPNSVNFTKDGYPNFSPYSKKTVKVDGLNGNYANDFSLANKAAGYKRTPDGYTWHHHQDGRTLQLVPTDLHSAVRHSGGASILRNN